ncbi:ABC transporter permease [Adhaeretor mobilis]|uniref:ABC-2 family transporter protein n=1 Tax=Adhaeretor mobilis TaxID=1930276 RepID=A0A517MWX9_9BACT|nr:ABC transporter permease [Adhaeretor mobilis]QDS99381.1 ABC-2 family transporter protein [Adhaeretor mobilis]
MSTADANTTEAERPTQATSNWRNWLEVLEHRVVGLLEWANPILVKETRQALKSKQFLLTFAIVLVACWIVSFAGRAIIGPQIFYIASGQDMLVAYYAILAFPLAVIVPFSAFRSLSAEKEDNTYDLLSITTLSSQQVITGKLGSAILQILIYFSVVSPCIAFTFLLRGVDAVSVALLLGVTLLASIGMSLIGLLAGTMASVRYTQMLLSVGLVLGMAFAFFGAVGVTPELLRESHKMIQDRDFWIGLGGVLTLYLTTFGLLHTAAAAQISFPSENRSTRIRYWMLLQQACFVAWMTVPPLLYPDEPEAVPVLACAAVGIGLIYWYVMGSIMTGEWPHLSRRVQRSLPSSLVGRSLFSWLNPGPASGYVFAVANSGALVALGLITLWANAPFPPFGLSATQISQFMLLGWCYLIIFLGLGRLLVSVLRRVAFVPLAAAFLVHLILMMAAIGVPAVIYSMSSQFRSSGYSLLLATNPFWTLSEVLESGLVSGREMLVYLLPAAAIVTFLLNLRAIGAELSRHRIAAPARVYEEEEELHPHPEPSPTSPWEEDPREPAKV